MASHVTYNVWQGDRTNTPQPMKWEDIVRLAESLGGRRWIDTMPLSGASVPISILQQVDDSVHAWRNDNGGYIGLYVQVSGVGT